VPKPFQTTRLSFLLRWQILLVLAIKNLLACAESWTRPLRLLLAPGDFRCSGGLTPPAAAVILAKYAKVNTTRRYSMPLINKNSFLGLLAGIALTMLALETWGMLLQQTVASAAQPQVLRPSMGARTG
jgi:hypothetical protein